MPDRHEIDEIRSRVDILSVIEPYVTLQRAGKNWKGLCPFHPEKSPSFHVNPELGRWHCFGSCSEGGDIFKFLQKIESLSFPEALERLALRAGVTLTRRSEGGRAPGAANAAPSEAGERDKLYRINALALRYYRDSLTRHTVAREYLQQRGLDHEICEKFAVGIAPDVWEGLTEFLTRNNIPLPDAEKAGLVAQSERGGWYEKLRGRLIFPILDVQERPIAFGGRLIAEGRPNQPKYWNSPETPLFSKSRTLYGLWRARKAIAALGKAVIVEGYTDVLAAHQAGFENVVATLGTALTEEHVKILARLAPTVLLAFDADSAGLQAAFRAAAIFEAQEIDVRVMALPPGEDPDSLLRSGQRQVFADAIDHALPLLEYRLQRLIQKSPLENERDRVALFRKALPILAAVPSVIEREQYVKMLTPYHPQFASGATFAEEQIRQDIAQMSGRFQSVSQERYTPPPAPRPPSSLPGGATEIAERQLLKALLSNEPELAGCVLAGIRPEEFFSPSAQNAAAALYAAYGERPDAGPEELLNSVTDAAAADTLSALVMGPEESMTVAALNGDIAHLRLHAKSRRLAMLKAQIDGGTIDAETVAAFVQLQKELGRPGKGPASWMGRT